MKLPPAIHHRGATAAFPALRSRLGNYSFTESYSSNFSRFTARPGCTLTLAPIRRRETLGTPLRGRHLSGPDTPALPPATHWEPRPPWSPRHRGGIACPSTSASGELDRRLVGAGA